jgi:prephenate dehydrogenase
MQLLGRVLAQSPELYVDIELENPYIPSSLEAYLKSVISFKKSIEDKQRDECLEFFNEAALAFGEYRNEALRISAKLIGKSSEHAVKD